MMRENMMKNIQVPCDNFKRHKIGVIEILRREGKENGANEIFEIKMSQIFPK
jgi:hypothetical protein